MIKLGYFGDGNNIDLNDETIGGLTNINWSFLTLQDKEGTLGHTWVNDVKLSEVKKMYPHIKICLAIGGWSASNFSEAVETQINRENFVKNAIDFVIKYDADGIDLDWEYPAVAAGGISTHPSDKQNFALFIQLLREKLDELGKETSKKYIVSCAVGASVSSQIGMDFQTITPFVDYYNVMTYDMGGTFATTGHQTSIYESNMTNQPGGHKTIKQLLDLGVPCNKLVYGCAFYGRGGTGVKNMDPKETGICSRYYGEQGLFFDYHDIVLKIESGEFTEYKDEEAIAVYAFNGDTFITYDNPWSIAQKVNYVKEMNLAGIMYWEHQTDLTRNLVKAIIES